MIHNKLVKTLLLLIVFVLLIPGKSFSEASKEELDEVYNKRAPIGLKGIELKEEESGEKKEVKRFILPPYVSEKTKNTTFKTVLPFFYFKQRVGEGARKDVGLLPFYWATDTKTLNARVYFPFYWKIRSQEFDMDLVLQTYHKRTSSGYSFGFAPLAFWGKDRDKKTSHQVILPPLFWNFKNPDGGTTWSLLYYNIRDKNTFSRGFVPFYFSRKKHDKTVTTILPPFFWHIKDDVNFKTTTVLPPFFVSTRKTGKSFGLLPLIYFARDKTWSRNMVMPFYYGSNAGKKKTRIFPLLLSYTKKDKNLNQGGIALFYHWYKKDGEYMNMYSPLAWRWGNTRTKVKNLLIPPLFFRGTSPVSSNTMVGLMYWNFNDFHLKKTFSLAPFFVHQKRFKEKSTRTYIFPAFDFGKSEDGFHARLHPLIYLGKDKESKHFVLAPLFWHFDKPKKRSTVAFPLYWQFYNKQYSRLGRVVFPFYWQFDDKKRNNSNKIVFPFYWSFSKDGGKRKSVVTIPPLFWRFKREGRTTTGALNVGLQKGKKRGKSYWTFNLFPFVLFGKPAVEEGVRWELLHGLVGWHREGDKKVFKFLWIPFGSRDKK